MGWNLKDLTATTDSPNAVSQPTGYVFDAFGSQHVTYLGTDWHIHELLWDPSGWHHHDLTSATSSPQGRNTAIGYVFLGIQHVIFFGAAVDHLWRDSHGWHYENILGASGAAAAGIGFTGRPIGYAFTAQRTQHVNFPDGLGNVQELWWDSAGGWHFNDLTAAAGAPRTGANPTGYVFNAQGTQHVNYVGVDSHVYELWWDTSGWHFNDLTAAAGAPLAQINRNAVGYVFPSQATQHVNYIGIDNHVHELWWDSSTGWHHHDLTAATGAPDANSEPAGFMFAGTQQVVFRGVDNHIHELSWDSSGWHATDLSADTGAAPTLYGNPTGYAFEAYGSQHVIYQADNNHVSELYWTS
jgi:hypothetical protein